MVEKKKGNTSPAFTPIALPASGLIVTNLKEALEAIFLVNGVNTVRGNGDCKDATMGANCLGLHRALCGSAADHDRRPSFRAFPV